MFSDLHTVNPRSSYVDRCGHNEDLYSLSYRKVGENIQSRFYTEPRECWFRSLALAKILVLVPPNTSHSADRICQD